jgi:opacity protein-like surface antigen
MRSVISVAVLGAVLTAPAATRAQSWETSGVVAYTPSAGLDNQAPEIRELNIGDGFTWGLQAARSLTPRWSAEALWTQQSSALTVGTDAGTADLFTMTVRQLHGDVLYHFGTANARLRPFVFGGLGATFFSADDLESETKFSFGLGAGVKCFRWDAMGVRAHFRYKPTIMNDEDAADFCDPFGFCQSSLQQIEVAAGAVLRF